MPGNIHDLIAALTDLNGGDLPKEIHVPGYQGESAVRGGYNAGQWAVTVVPGSAMVIWPDRKKWVPRAQWIHKGETGPKLTAELVAHYEEQRAIQALHLVAAYAKET
jgi:hypothetical protein